MQKRTKFKSQIRDFVVVTFCLSVALFFLYLFWQDLNRYTIRTDKNEIGKISFKENIVQRKFDDRVVWERIANETKLYYGDTIKTAELAHASLELLNGTVHLELSESTMIQMGTNADGGIQIAIAGGDIQIDSTSATSGLEVKFDDGSLINVDAGSSLSATNDATTGTHNVEVKSGNATLTTESGEVAELKNGESANIAKGKEIQRNSLTILYPPKTLKLLNITKEKTPVRFDWNSKAGETVTIQTSSTRDFSTINSVQEIKNLSSAEVDFPNGTCFWRVFTENSKNRPIEGKVTIEGISNAKGISPAQKSVFKYRKDLPRITFRWNGNEHAERYRLVVSTAKNMREIVYDSEIKGTFLSLDNLQEGTYWWQVSPYYSLGNLGYAGKSDVYEFEVLKNQEMNRPELSSPAENAKIVYKENINTNFIWKSELKNAKYDFFIARDMDFTNIVYSKEIADTRYAHEFAPHELRDGTYYWKVRRKSSDSKDLTPESEIRSFRVTRYIPQDNKLVYPPEDFLVDGSKLPATAFMWKLSDDYDESSTTSVMQISSNSNFSNIVVEKNSSASVIDNLSLSSGNYWWRVGVRNSSGTASDFSQSRMFTVLAEIAPPDFISPRPNQELVSYNSEPLMISWAGVSEAKSYKLKICKDSGEVVKTLPGIAETNTSVVLEEGSYVGLLQSVASETRISAATQVNFTVRAPSIIIPQSPSDGAAIPGLSALRSPTVFSWAPGREQASTYTLVLSKLNKNGSETVVKSIKTSKNTASISRLTKGSYTWKVLASVKGIPIDSKPMKFVIEEIPALHAPVLDAPAQDFIMDGAYLKSHRVIEFNWQEVSGATAYNFTLYKKTAGKRGKAVHTVKNTKGTSVLIKDLSIFELGTFEWTVTPFSYAKDGYLEQSGPASSHVFKIDFDSPTNVEGVQPEIMYGN
ncbi:hypothetical protein [Treponema zioleckii]|uniref:hypothetical protein n=1 Tax=Treponema zioleckii TaxID=331680 RepID=UPI00168BDF2F|nr:hypothetical protein [Treponema zioleckii]